MGKIRGLFLNLPSKIYQNKFFHDLMAGIFASLLVTFFLTSGYSPYTSPDLEMREPVITDQGVKVIIENDGKQSAKNKGLAVRSGVVGYSKTKYFDLGAGDKRSIHFYNLPAGRADKDVSPLKMEVRVENKSKVSDICENLESTRNLSRDDSYALVDINRTWKHNPADYEAVFGDNETNEITIKKSFSYPLESEVINSSSVRKRENVILNRRDDACYLEISVDYLDLPEFEFSPKVDGYINRFNK
jgi:hypothetical protein